MEIYAIIRDDGEYLTSRIVKLQLVEVPRG